MELRQEQIREWAKAAAQQGKKTMAQHFRAMANAEHTKHTFRLLQNVIKPQDRSGITKLKVPTIDEHGERVRNKNGDEQWHLPPDPQEIEKTIIEQNIQHFGQATDTPFNSTEFTDIFGIGGDSEATEDLLQGILPAHMSGLSTKVQLILKEISKKSQPTIDTTIPIKDVKKSLQEL
jgi:hypothetical protein